MATTDFSKINWGDYQNWEQVATPSGEMFYLVPGTGWAYNPFMSAQTGRVQLFPNPKLALQKQAEQEAEIAQAKKDAERKSGLGYQLLQTAMPAAVALGTKYAYDKWLDPNVVTKPTTETGKSWLSSLFGGGETPATPAANPLTGEVGLGGSSSTSSSGAPGYFAQAPGSEFLGSETLGSFLPAAGIAAGLYTGLQQFGGAKKAFSGDKLSTKEQAALALPTFGASLLFNHIPGLTQKSSR